jgi:hypothetical protein
VRAATLVVVGVLVLVGRNLVVESPSPDHGSGDGEREILELFESGRSGEMVTVAGIIDRSLSDDNDGSRHQRFILRLSSGHTVLVAHNIDLAERVPLSPGDHVLVRGEYEWNEQGGVLHWTHRDPAGDRPGGWIEFGGDRYR